MIYRIIIGFCSRNFRLGGLDSHSTVYHKVLSILEREYKLREQEFKLQEKLIKQQIEYMKSKATAIKKGITLDIKADGMEHEIEAFMYKIVEKIHAKAVGDEAEFLISIPGSY